MLFTLGALASSPSLVKGGEACYLPDKCETTICCPDNPTGYIFAYGGVSLEATNQFNRVGGTPGGETWTDEGYIYGGGAGVYSCLMGGTRFEIEGIYSELPYERYAATGTNTFQQGAGAANTGQLFGDLTYTAVLINVLKEFDVPCTGIEFVDCVTEGSKVYFGGGFGLAFVEAEPVNPLGNANNATVQVDDMGLAYQLIVGVEKPVFDCVDLFAQYKLIGVGETEGTRGNNALAAIELEDFYTHNFVFGAKVNF